MGKSMRRQESLGTILVAGYQTLHPTSYNYNIFIINQFKIFSHFYCDFIFDAWVT